MPYLTIIGVPPCVWSSGRTTHRSLWHGNQYHSWTNRKGSAIDWHTPTASNRFQNAEVPAFEPGEKPHGECNARSQPKGLTYDMRACYIKIWCSVSHPKPERQSQATPGKQRRLFPVQLSTSSHPERKQSVESGGVTHGCT